MSLRIIVGRSNADTSARVEAEVRRAAEGGPVTLLLPALRGAEGVRSGLSASFPVGVQVTTIRAWAEGLWTRLGDGRRLVSPSIRDALAHRAAEESWEDSTSRRGIARTAARLAAGWDLRNIVTVSNNVPFMPVLLRYRDLVAGRGLVEPTEAFASLAEQSLPACGVIGLDGFLTLGRWEEALLLSASRTSDVVLALPWEPGLPSSEIQDPLLTRLATSGTVEHVPPTESESGPTALAARLFTSHAPLPSDGTVCFGSAAGDEAETALIVQQVAAAIGEGLAPSDICIVYRRLGSQVDRLTAALRAEGVRAEVDMRVPMEALPFGRALLALLTVAAGHGGREELLAFLSGPYTDADPAEVTRLDLEWRRRREGDARKLLRDSRRLGGRAAQAVQAAERLSEDRDRIVVAEAWRDLARAMLASSLGRRGCTQFQARRDAASHAAILSMIGDAVLEAGITDSGDLISTARRIDVSVVPEGDEDAVRLVEADRMPRRGFRMLVVGGLNADGFGAGRRDELVPEYARRLGLQPQPDERLLERLLFYSVISRAETRLVLVRAAMGADGGARRPSVFWEEALDRYRRPGDDDESIPAHVPAVRLALTDLADSAPAMSEGRRDLRRAETSERRSRRRRGALTDVEALASLAATSTFTVTELESYLKCPFRWFYERVVSPREVDRMLGAREMGAFAHDLLRDFYSAFFDVGHERVTEDSLPEALSLFDGLAEAAMRDTALRPQGLCEEIDVARAVKGARAIVVDDASFLPGWKPAAFEQPFGKDDAPAFVFADVGMVGRIDRIDTNGTHVVVSDYKLGRDYPGHGTFAKRGVLQPVVYACAAASLLDRDVAAGLFRSMANRQARGFWLRGTMEQPRGGSSKDGLDAEGWDALLEETAAMVGEAVSGIRNGDIRVRPTEGQACKYCSAARVCGGSR